MSFYSIIQSAQKAIAGSAGVEIKYFREDKWVRFTATPGLTVTRVNDTYGPVSYLRGRSYIFPVCELELDGDPTQPQPGDVIEEVIENKLFRYEVKTGDGSDVTWRYTDYGQTHYRVETRQIGESII